MICCLASGTAALAEEAAGQKLPGRPPPPRRATCRVRQTAAAPLPVNPSPAGHRELAHQCHDRAGRGQPGRLRANHRRRGQDAGVHPERPATARRRPDQCRQQGAVLQSADQQRRGQAAPSPTVPEHRAQDLPARLRPGRRRTAGTSRSRKARRSESSSTPRPIRRREPRRPKDGRRWSRRPRALPRSRSPPKRFLRDRTPQSPSWRHGPGTRVRADSRRSKTRRKENHGPDHPGPGRVGDPPQRAVRPSAGTETASQHRPRSRPKKPRPNRPRFRSRCAVAPPPPPLRVGAADARFSGHPLTLDLIDISLVDFFRLMSEEGGINVVMDPEIKGNLSIKVVKVPWDQIFEAAMMNNGLDKQIDGNLVRIARKSTLQEEAKQRESTQEGQPPRRGPGDQDQAPELCEGGRVHPAAHASRRPSAVRWSSTSGPIP